MPGFHTVETPAAGSSRPAGIRAPGRCSSVEGWPGAGRSATGPPSSPPYRLRRADGGSHLSSIRPPLALWPSSSSPDTRVSAQVARLPLHDNAAVDEGHRYAIDLLGVPVLGLLKSDLDPETLANALDADAVDIRSAEPGPHLGLDCSSFFKACHEGLLQDQLHAQPVENLADRVHVGYPVPVGSAGVTSGEHEAHGEAILGEDE